MNQISSFFASASFSHLEFKTDLTETREKSKKKNDPQIYWQKFREKAELDGEKKEVIWNADCKLWQGMCREIFNDHNL